MKPFLEIFKSDLLITSGGKASVARIVLLLFNFLEPLISILVLFILVTVLLKSMFIFFLTIHFLKPYLHWMYNFSLK